MVDAIMKIITKKQFPNKKVREKAAMEEASKTADMYYYEDMEFRTYLKGFLDACEWLKVYLKTDKSL